MLGVNSSSSRPDVTIPGTAKPGVNRTDLNKGGVDSEQRSTFPPSFTHDSLVGTALGQRLGQLNEQLLALAPEVDRIACVLYDSQDDLLKTFVDSRRIGQPISGYAFRWEWMFWRHGSGSSDWKNCPTLQ